MQLKFTTKTFSCQNTLRSNHAFIFLLFLCHPFSQTLYTLNQPPHVHFISYLLTFPNATPLKCHHKTRPGCTLRALLHEKPTDIPIEFHIKASINNSMTVISNTTHTHTHTATQTRTSQGQRVTLRRGYINETTLLRRIDLIRRRRWDLFAEGQPILGKIGCEVFRWCGVKMVVL